MKPASKQIITSTMWLYSTTCQNVLEMSQFSHLILTQVLQCMYPEGPASTIVPQGPCLHYCLPKGTRSLLICVLLSPPCTPAPHGTCLYWIGCPYPCLDCVVCVVCALGTLPPLNGVRLRLLPLLFCVFLRLCLCCTVFP
jgi:hypothetical protein